jgi:hypothetical protein
VGASICNAAEIKRVNGVDLFVDLKDYIGQEIILTDGLVSTVDSTSMLISAGNGAVRFFVHTPTIVDRESLRFFLSNCAGYSSKPQCQMPLLVTPTGGKDFMSNPILKNVKMVPAQ